MTAVRPPFILALAADQQGCGFHRINVPLGTLASSNLADGRIDMSTWPDDAIVACNPDVIVFQRYVDDAHFEVMRRYRRLLPKALFIYELDDHLGAVPSVSYHYGYMPPNLTERVAQGISLCDRVTTTTEPMAEWLRSLGAEDVRIVPNAVPMARLKERTSRISGKLRVGWAGGMSHKGDLEILRPVMEAIGEDVDWVFMGMQLDNAPVRVQFHPGTSPTQYLDVMAQLDIDLMLAPLEDHLFNQCKSNLRLLEAACIGVPVIASAVEPYMTGGPPIVHATTTEEWVIAIRRFMEMEPTSRDAAARALRAWVGRHHTLEATRQLRLEAWTTEEMRWTPSPGVMAGSGHIEFVVACPVGVDRATLPAFMRNIKDYRLLNSLEAACEMSLKTGADVLWLRPGTALDETGWNRLRATLKMTNERGEASVATAMPIASDGVNSFPNPREFSMVAPTTAQSVQRAMASRMVGKTARITAPGGPCVLISARSLAMFGIPDTRGCETEEAAILEWGLRLVPRGMIHVQALDAYVASLAQPAPLTARAAQRMNARGITQYAYAQSEPFLPHDREAVELMMLKDQWAGPKPGLMGFGNDYAAWDALGGSKSNSRTIHDDTVIRDVSMAGERTIRKGASQWFVFVDDTIQLRPNALIDLQDICVKADPSVRIVYADHDMLQNGKLTPDFKPNFDLELFLGRDYVTQICAVRAHVAEFDEINDRADLYDLVLNTALDFGPKAFRHLPRVLATVKDGETPEAKAMMALQREQIVKKALGDDATVEVRRDLPGTLKIVRQWKNVSSSAPPVSIIIPTLGSGKLIQPCVNTIRTLTTYPNWEILIVHNGPRAEPELNEEAANDPRVRWVRWDATPGEGFNWSKACNFGMREARGAYFCLLNDDTCVASPGWLDAMMGQALRSEVGVVGARLIHPGASVYQHVGVVVHEGIAGHLHKGTPVGNPGYWGIATISHEASAVTGACMLVCRDTVKQHGGFDESFPLNYGDVEFCLRLRDKGYVNVVEAAADLMHSEGTTRSEGKNFADPEVLQSLAKDNAKLIAMHPEPDPYWNPNLGIGLAQGGAMVQGLNCELLAWKNDKPADNAQRVLLINDLPGSAGLLLEEHLNGVISFAADISGFQLQLVAPQTQNTPSLDIRDMGHIASVLSMLGIDRIVLRSLIGRNGAAAPVETLLGLRWLADSSTIKVEVNPFDDLFVCPWREMTRANDPKVFGNVDMRAWQRAYTELGDLVSDQAEAAE